MVSFQSPPYIPLDFRNLPHRQWAHPFDRSVPGPTNDRGVDASPNAIGGYYGIGWTEYFRCHHTGVVYEVSCSDGVNGGKGAYSDRDDRWMRQARKHIIARTMSQPKGPIKLSTREWHLMLHFNFVGWLDEVVSEDPNAPRKTVGDASRHLEEGQIGTIGGVPVVVDPGYRDDLPPVGKFRFSDSDTIKPVRAPRDATHEPNRFGGVFAAAFAKAGIG